MRLLIVMFLCTTTAYADESVTVEPIAIAQRLASDGAFTPGMLRARDDGGGFVVAATQYSGARQRAQLDVLGEVHVWGPFRIVLGVADAFRSEAKPSGGVGVRIVDGLSGYVRYKTEGFTEPEGEIEATLAGGVQLGAVRLAGNLTYGQDPEGNERDGEIAAAAQINVLPELVGGITAQYRDALGSTKEMVVRDGLAGAASTWSRGHVAVTGLVGVAMFEPLGMPRQWGPAATLALGAAF